MIPTAIPVLCRACGRFLFTGELGIHDTRAYLCPRCAEGWEW